MRRSLLKYLADMQVSLEELAEIVFGQTLEDYENKLILRRAVERQFIILAEIVTRIRTHFPDTMDRIDRIAPVRSFRNILVHEYELVQDDVVWKTASLDALVLRREIDDWVMELDPAWDPSQGL